MTDTASTRMATEAVDDQGGLQQMHGQHESDGEAYSLYHVCCSSIQLHAVRDWAHAEPRLAAAWSMRLKASDRGAVTARTASTSSSTLHSGTRRASGPFRGMMQSYAAPPHGYVAPISSHMQQQQQQAGVGSARPFSGMSTGPADCPRLPTGRPEGGSQVENLSADTPNHT